MRLPKESDYASNLCGVGLYTIARFDWHVYQEARRGQEHVAYHQGAADACAKILELMTGADPYENMPLVVERMNLPN